MKVARLLLFLACGSVLASSLTGANQPTASSAPATNTNQAEASSRSATNDNAALASKSWYFAVSGDSRDCGDLIMPKIANSVAAKSKQLPLKFYWHLGDFRALYRIDCDMGLVMEPSFKCVQGSASPSETAPMKQQYLKTAWPDFIEHEVKPFEQAGLSIYLGIGNHETMDHRSRDQFRLAFKPWLTQPTLTAQRQADAKKNIVSKDGDTYFHFVMKGVDFIYLDNADGKVGFSAEQLAWLAAVLKADAMDQVVKTIIVGMHAALPHSISSNHAMDESCPAMCSGARAYNLLDQAQNSGPASTRKHVYVLASHSHFFEENIYNTAQHKGHVLPGWIVGTAGAEQYHDTIRYGYMLVEVKSDGTIGASFTDVDRNSPPLMSGAAGAKITNYCFDLNKKGSTSKAAQGCNCSN